MRTPVLIDGLRLRWFGAPELGETVRWGLSWNSEYPRRWAVLDPAWSLTAEIRPSSKPMMRWLTMEPDVTVPQQPSIGRVGALQFVFNAHLPVQSSISVSGALQLLAGTSRSDSNARQAWADFHADAVTVGVVRRLRLVSIESDMLPDQLGSRWLSMQFVAGTERFYELAHPPTALRSYRLTDRENGPYRQDYLLVDLETE